MTTTHRPKTKITITVKMQASTAAEGDNVSNTINKTITNTDLEHYDTPIAISSLIQTLQASHSDYETITLVHTSDQDKDAESALLPASSTDVDKIVIHKDGKIEYAGDEEKGLFLQTFQILSTLYRAQDQGNTANIKLSELEAAFEKKNNQQLVGFNAISAAALPPFLLYRSWVLWHSGWATGKQITGGYAFWKSTGLNDKIAITLGFACALAPFLFYDNSNTKVSGGAIEGLLSLMTKSKDPAAACNIYLMFLQQQLPPNTIHPISWKFLVQLLLGIGYGAGNFGMTWQNIPDTFQNKVWEYFFLISIAYTNGTVGINYAEKPIDDVLQTIHDIFHDRGKNRLITAQTKLVKEALTSYEKTLAMRYGLTSTVWNTCNKQKAQAKQQADARRNQLKDEVTSCFENNKVNLTKLLATVKNHIHRLQQEINKEITNYVKTVNRKKYTALESGDSSYKNNALNKPLKLIVPAKSTTPAADWSLSGIVWLTSLLAISGNIYGVGWGLFGFTERIEIQMITGIIGSIAVYGLNKRDGDAGKNYLLRFFAESLTVHINKKNETFWNKLPSALTVFALALSAFNATPNIGFAMIGMIAIFGYTSLVTQALYWSSIASTGLYVTTTKAGPTRDKIQEYVDWLGVSALSSKLLQYFGKEPETNRQEMDFITKQCEILMEAIVDMLEQYQVLWDHHQNVSFDQLGLPVPDTKKSLKEISSRLVDATTPDELLELLYRELKTVGANYQTAYAATNLKSLDANTKLKLE